MCSAVVMRASLLGDLVNFAHIVKFGKQYSNFNEIHACSVRRHCILGTVQWEELRKIRIGKLRPPLLFEF